MGWIPLRWVVFQGVVLAVVLAGAAVQVLFWVMLVRVPPAAAVVVVPV